MRHLAGAFPVLVLLAAACSRGEPAAAPVQLEVDAEQWPLHVLELGQSTIRLMKGRGEIAYLTKIHINLPDVNETTGTDVTYEFYSPVKRKLLTVTYLHTDVSVRPEEMEQARRAGVDKILRAAQDATRAPQFGESALRDRTFVPTPLPGAQLGLRDAYALARRQGLTRASGIGLSISDKDPKQPLVMWTFEGQHTRSDSQAIHIDAVTGAYVDEDRINALSRAERAAQLAQGLAAIQAFLRPRYGGAMGWSGSLVPEAAAVVNGGGQQQEHGYYFDGLRDYTLGPASECAARGGTDGGPASFGGNYCY